MKQPPEVRYQKVGKSAYWVFVKGHYVGKVMRWWNPRKAYTMDVWVVSNSRRPVVTYYPTRDAAARAAAAEFIERRKESA